MSEVIYNAEQTNESATENTLLTTESNDSTEETQNEAVQNESKQTDKTETVVREAPESYSFDNVDVSQEILDEYSIIAKELNMPQEEATKMLSSLAPKFKEVQAKEIESMKNAWIESTKNDKELGGDGLNENLSIAKKALNNFGNEGLNNLLNETGLGNHPEVIRFFHNVGKAISEDGYVSGKTTNQQKTLAERMYGNS